MKRRPLFSVVILVLVFSCWGGGFIAAQESNDYDRVVTQSEFATGVVGAILGQPRTGVDPADALIVLKDNDLVPATWTGDGDVSMGEAAQAFHQLGFQVYVEDSEALLTSGVFEQILRQHMGEIKRTKQHWDIVHHFSMGLELGQYRERILGPDGIPPVSPAGF